MHTKTLNYAKLADIKQGEKKTPDKFLDRLQEALCWSQKDRERNDLKDRFLTQSAPGICHKLQKQAFRPNQSSKNCYSWLRWYIMVKNTRRKREKKPGKRLKPPKCLLDPLWNGLRRSAQSNPGEKGWTYYYGGKERHLKQDCPQASNRQNDHTWGEIALWDIGPRVWTLKAIRTESAWESPHKLPS